MHVHIYAHAYACSIIYTRTQFAQTNGLMTRTRVYIINASNAMPKPYLYIVHPESFKSNAQNANAFARRNRPRVERNDEFACVYLRLRACVCIRLRVLFAIDRVRVHACVRAHVHIYIRFGHGITCVNYIYTRTRH